MPKKVFIALGGNALGNTPLEQKQIVRKTAKPIVDLVEKGYQVIIGHGNGPQVGMINLAMDYASQQNIGTPYMPFAECGAMSQSYIGYHLQQAINDELCARNLNNSCATVVTQVVVDKQDPAFLSPTKPIGAFYTKEQAETIQKEHGFHFMEDAGRGYRRVIPSPKPLEIVESLVIKQLVENNVVVITVGGGGIPVIRKNGVLEGVDAVIDKDNSSSKLAVELKAETLLILTAVDKVAIHFNTPKQKNLDKLTLSQAQEYINNGEFAKGSMLPKVEACLNFIKERGSSSQAIITSLDNALSALEGKTGTTITLN
ncbi:carbamate kinase [Proteus hauseri ATCC 700826]|uniref:Carbamate kinase n=1 Tax=Proteus hauseri ATCC 700826 TaxID=1354271 RepID=A0AAJ3HUF7_PROHU|nr:carbamate kinase [Proteus hauseri]OAT49485.1 carbamate kinase [Proteus hauseri ATCC 700826]